MCMYFSLQEAKERKKRKEMGWDDEYLVRCNLVDWFLFCLFILFCFLVSSFFPILRGIQTQIIHLVMPIYLKILFGTRYIHVHVIFVTMSSVDSVIVPGLHI